MSATLGSLLQQLEPDWTITILESLGDVALESSNPWNNAGTGHSALCELNYTPETRRRHDRHPQAVKVNEQFQVSRQFWSFLVSEGLLPEPDAVHQPGAAHELRVGRRERRLPAQALRGAQRPPAVRRASSTATTPRVIRSLGAAADPRARKRRSRSPPPASSAGTDVDFGSLTRPAARRSRRRAAPTLHARAPGHRPQAQNATASGASPAATTSAAPRSSSPRASCSSARAAPRSTCCSVRHQGDPRLRRLPDQRPVPAHRRPGGRRPASREGLRQGGGRLAADVGAAPRHPRRRRHRRACCSGRTPASRPSS